MARVLVTGIAGSLAQLTAARLVHEGHEVTGVDYRPVTTPMRVRIPVFQANYNKTRIEDIVRRARPTHLLHLGRVGNLKVHAGKRFDLNVLGSAKIMGLCLKYEVQRLVVLSTFHIYGAHPLNHIPIYEDEPLRAGQGFPQLADAVQLDAQASTWVYRYRRMRTVVLRPCNVVGPNIHNHVSTYLRSPRLIFLAGFSPMWQFVHEADMVQALLLTLFGEQVGVYNVAGRGELPLVEALRLTGNRLVPVPSLLANVLLRGASRFATTFPPYLLDFFKYPCVVSDAKIRRDFGYEPQAGIEETIRYTARGAGPLHTRRRSGRRVA